MQMLQLSHGAVLVTAQGCLVYCFLVEDCLE